MKTSALTKALWIAVGILGFFALASDALAAPRPPRPPAPRGGAPTF